MTLPVAPHILITSNDAAIVDLLTQYFAQHDLRVSVANSEQDMFELLIREAVDLVLLDLKLPVSKSIQLTRTLREQTTVPLIFLSTCLEEADRVMALELGADDFVTKPFSPRELLARIRAVLRRFRAAAPLPDHDHTCRAFRFSGWELNLRTRRLKSSDGMAVKLSNGEFNLLSALCRAPQRVLTRNQLLSMSRLHDEEVFDRSIDVQIRRLRLKIEADPARPALIITERGGVTASTAVSGCCTDKSVRSDGLALSLKLLPG